MRTKPPNCAKSSASGFKPPADSPAHAQGLVHRDIKPANLLLENGVERVKITDFGLARVVDDDVTQNGVVAGTPQYMSPEQAGARRSTSGPTCSAWAASSTRCVPAGPRRSGPPAQCPTSNGLSTKLPTDPSHQPLHSRPGSVPGSPSGCAQGPGARRHGSAAEVAMPAGPAPRPAPAAGSWDDPRDTRSRTTPAPSRGRLPARDCSARLLLAAGCPPGFPSCAGADPVNRAVAPST